MTTSFAQVSGGFTQVSDGLNDITAFLMAIVGMLAVLMAMVFTSTWLVYCLARPQVAFVIIMMQDARD